MMGLRSAAAEQFYSLVIRAILLILELDCTSILIATKPKAFINGFSVLGLRALVRSVFRSAAFGQ